MSNRRQLKKAVNGICGELFAECVAIRHYSNVKNLDDVDNVMRAILILQNDIISRVSHVEPGMKAKVFFARLKDDFQAGTNEIVDSIQTLF